MFLNDIEKKIFFSNNYLSTQKVISRYIDQLEPEDNQNKLFALRHLTNLHKGTCYAKKWRKYLHSVINSDQPLQNIKNFDYRDKNEERKLTARKANIDRLYEESVQCPEFEVSFIKKLFKKYFNTKCISLREDFCASALISSEWVKDNKNNTSISVDLDKRMISAAKKTAQNRLDNEQRSRMKIRYGDSSKYKGDIVDCILATNFSYFVFKDRQKLIKYFSNAYSQLKKKDCLC